MVYPVYTDLVKGYFMDNFLDALTDTITLPNGDMDTVNLEAEIALPGKLFDAEGVDTSRVWFEPGFTTPSPAQSFLGTGAWKRLTGYFNVQIYCPLALGEDIDIGYARPILDKFPMGTGYDALEVHIRCTSAGIIGSEKNDTYNRWQLSVRIVFEAETKY